MESEKKCPDCNNVYPVTGEFWYFRWRKSNMISEPFYRPMAYCKTCQKKRVLESQRRRADRDGKCLNPRCVICGHRRASQTDWHGDSVCPRCLGVLEGSEGRVDLILEALADWEEHVRAENEKRDAWNARTDRRWRDHQDHLMGSGLPTIHRHCEEFVEILKLAVAYLEAKS